MKHNFKNLQIWQRSRVFVKNIYINTKQFPKEETYSLTNQIRRAAISIPSNISEGCGRSTDPQLFHFLDIAIASACEVETQLYLSLDLGYMSEKQCDDLTQEVSEIRRMLVAFQQKFRRKR